MAHSSYSIVGTTSNESMVCESMALKPTKQSSEAKWRGSRCLILIVDFHLGRAMQANTQQLISESLAVLNGRRLRIYPLASLWLTPVQNVLKANRMF